MTAIVVGGDIPMPQKITPFSWINRFTLAEQAAIREAAKVDSEIEAIEKAFDKISDARGVDPTSPLATALLQVFVSKGLLDSGRVPVIQFTPISPDEAV